MEQKKQLSQNNIDDIIFRNEVLCDLLGFKKYIPNKKVEAHHSSLSQRTLRWFTLPEVGNYSSAELRFHCDWNWLMSVVIEFKKYDGLDADITTLYYLYRKIKNTELLNVNMHDLYMKLTDYAVAVWQQKQKEQNKSL